MNSCGFEDRVERALRGDGALDEILTHAGTCAACKRRLDGAALVERVIEHGNLDDSSSLERRLSWARLEAGLPAERPRRVAAPWMLSFAGAAALALVFVLGRETAIPEDELVARGGGPAALFVEALCVSDGAGAALVPEGGDCPLQASLGFIYGNAKADRYLTLFGIQRGPLGAELRAYVVPAAPDEATRAEAQPRAAAARTVRLAVHHEPGDLWLIAATSRRPLLLAEVQKAVTDLGSGDVSRLGAALDAEQLVTRRLVVSR